jgi:hypothetical protein
MRYLLIVVGLLGVLVGFWGIAAGRANARPAGEFFVQVGAVFLAAGLATVDVVEEIRAKRL